MTKVEMNLIQGIAFDLEGTIVDLENLHHSAHLHAASDVGVNMSKQEAIECISSFIGGPDEKVAEEIASRANFRVEPDLVLKAKQKYFTQFMNSSVDFSPRDGFMQCLSWIKEAGLKVSIGTVTKNDQAKRIIKQAGLLYAFSAECIVTRDDIVSLKPAPDVYYETARRMGITPESQMVFEDSLVGLVAARSAGCRVVAVPTLQSEMYIEKLYNEGAEAVFQNWHDSGIQDFIIRMCGGRVNRVDR